MLKFRVPNNESQPIHPNQHLSGSALRKDITLRERDEEIKAHGESNKQRARLYADQIIQKVQKRNWNIVRGLWVIVTLIAVFGQFFVWRGIDWLTQSSLHMIAGAIIIFFTLLAASFGLRWVAPGKFDLATILYNRLARRQILMLLSKINPADERKRIQDAILERHKF